MLAMSAGTCWQAAADLCQSFAQGMHLGLETRDRVLYSLLDTELSYGCSDVLQRKLSFALGLLQAKGSIDGRMFHDFWPGSFRESSKVLSENPVA